MCGGEWDPIAKLAESNAREAAFVAAYPRVHCPACKKRLSPSYDNVNARFDGESVEMVCSHCGHRFILPRQRAAK